MDYTLSFFVPGQPIPQPRPRFDIRTGRTYTKGRHAGSRDVTAWKHAVSLKALALMRAKDLAPLEGPVWFQTAYAMPRPKAHHVAGDPARELKASAPHWHTKKPDRDNLNKAVMDALNGVVWVDDSQVVAGPSLKFYASSRARVGVAVAFCGLPAR